MRSRARADSKVPSPEPLLKSVPTPTPTPTQDAPSPASLLCTMKSISDMYLALSRWCRPTLRRAHTRLEWHDCNGQNYWGDFEATEEQVYSLAVELQQQGFTIDHTTTAATTTTLSTISHQSSQSTGASTTPTPVPQMSTSNPTSLRSINKPVFLELCIETALGITQLVEVVIVDSRGQQLIHTDVELFAAIRQKYESMRRTGLCAYLYQPIDIQFVLFGIHSQEIGIFKSPENTGIPPPADIYAKRYHYYPCPLPCLPPMPSKLFYRYFWKHPTCCSRSTTWIDRLPKKLGDSLAAINDNGLHHGWGIHIVEGPRKSLVAIISGTAVVLSGMVAVIHNAQTHNKDTGFTIAAWLLSATAVLLAALVFYLSQQ